MKRRDVPAFPPAASDVAGFWDESKWTDHHGMTLREYAAIHIMAGLKFQDFESSENAAKAVVESADALLEELEK